MDPKPTLPNRPVGIQAMTPKLYEQVRRAIRALAPVPVPAAR